MATRITSETFGPCWQCGGSGWLYNGAGTTSATMPCPRCAGTGQIVTSRTVTEDIPVGQTPP